MFISLPKYFIIEYLLSLKAFYLNKECSSSYIVFSKVYIFHIGKQAVQGDNREYYKLIIPCYEKDDYRLMMKNRLR